MSWFEKKGIQRPPTPMRFSEVYTRAKDTVDDEAKEEAARLAGKMKDVLTKREVPVNPEEPEGAKVVRVDRSDVQTFIAEVVEIFGEVATSLGNEADGGKHIAELPFDLPLEAVDTGKVLGNNRVSRFFAKLSGKNVPHERDDSISPTIQMVATFQSKSGGATMSVWSEDMTPTTGPYRAGIDSGKIFSPYQPVPKTLTDLGAEYPERIDRAGEDFIHTALYAIDILEQVAGMPIFQAPPVI